MDQRGSDRWLLQALGDNAYPMGEVSLPFVGIRNVNLWDKVVAAFRRAQGDSVECVIQPNRLLHFQQNQPFNSG